MSLIASMIKHEAIRNENMISEYMNELQQLPKGTIKPKTINGKVYFYLCYRNGKKVVTEYIGKDEEKLTALRLQLTRRSQVEDILRKLKEEKMQIKKVEAIL